VLVFQKHQYVVAMNKEENKKSNLAMMHGLAEASPNCPNCDSPPQEHTVENYDMMWHDGDVVCTKCGTKVRNYDAG